MTASRFAYYHDHRIENVKKVNAGPARGGAGQKKGSPPPLKLRRASKDQGAKGPKQGLLARETEHPAVVSAPPAARIRPVVVEPQTDSAASDAEHVRLADQAGNLFHGN